MMTLFSCSVFSDIFVSLIGRIDPAMLPLRKTKLPRKYTIIKFGNHFKTDSKVPGGFKNLKDLLL